MNFKHIADLIGLWFELLGSVILVIGAMIAFVVYGITLMRYRHTSAVAYRNLRRDLGKAILIGLELLVAADIIHSVAIDPTFESVGILGLIVIVRTFLSWSLEVEINGRWPWQHALVHSDAPADSDEP